MFDQIPEWFRQTKAGKEAGVEAQAQQRSAREGLVHQAETARAQLTAALPALDKAMAEAQVVVEKAAGALREAEAKARGAYAKKRSVVVAHEATIARAESELRKTADPAITVLCDDLVKLVETMRAAPVGISVLQRNWDGVAIKVDTWPQDDYLARMAAIQLAVREECAALCLRPETTLGPQIAELRERFGLVTAPSAA